ncbi:MAG: hypothetical protein KDD85_13670 [Parvularculaceae bacterium]|nr:hypothetical protein [Parvularculaceae bacterium]
MDLFALAYFYGKWASREPRHRQFHFLMMLSYLASTTFFAYRGAVAALPIDAFAMSEWWYELISNILFELELIFIFTYSLLFRRAKANRNKFRADSTRWLERVGEAKKNIFRRSD